MTGKFPVPLLKILIAILALSAFYLCLRPADRVGLWPLSEDGYYAFSVARNLALGNGVTIDGATLTNGFQPLFVFLIVPAFWASPADLVLPIRFVLIFSWLVYLATGFLLGRIVQDVIPAKPIERRQLAFWLTCLVCLAASQVYAVHFNGLETGCLLLLIALTWRYYQTSVSGGRRDIILGVLLGLVVLARIDASLLVVVVCVGLLLKRGESSLPQRSRESATIAITSFLVSSPWWLYNLTCFGSLMPSSGASQQSWDGFNRFRLGQSIDALSLVLMPHVKLGPLEHPLLIGFRLLAFTATAVALKGVLRLIKAVPREDEARIQRTVEFGTFVLCSSFALVLYYTLASGSWHFYARYFSPLLLISVAMISIAILHAKRTQPKVVGVSLLLLSLPLTAALYVSHTRAADRSFNAQYHTEQLALVSEYVNDSEYVGAGQTGTLGYYRQRVVNLDGKVNAAALAYQENMWEYLRAENIDWFCDWEQFVSYYLGARPADHGWKFIAERGAFKLYHRER